MAHAVRGWALEAQRDFLNASTSIDKALEIDPKNALAHAYKAELLADQYIAGSGALDVVARMSDESNLALSLGPDLLESHRARGYVLEATGNTADAIREYELAVNINKYIADVHVSLGRCYRALNVYDKAVTAFTVANQLNPTDPTPLLYISRVYYTTGAFPKAEQYAQQAVKTNPSDTALRGNLGVMYYRNLKWPLAATELSYVVNGGTDKDGVQITPFELSADTPRVTEYYFTYGLVLSRLNRCGEALPIFQKILTTAPNDEIAVYNANEGIRLCSVAAGATPSTDSGTPGAPTSGTPSRLTPTPTVTPTP
jgi:tetratricopeptide (TPR) repeat protein